MDKQNLEHLYNGISFSHKKAWSTDTYTIWMNLKNITLSKISQAQRLYTMFPFIWNILSSVQSLSRVWLFETPWNAARQASLSITNSWNLLKLMSIESVMPSNHLILCYPLLLLPSVFPSNRVFSNKSVLCKGCQSIGVSVSASVFPMNIQDWFALGFTGLISLQSKGLSRIFSNTTVQNHQFFSTQLSLWSNSCIYTWLLEKP